MRTSWSKSLRRTAAALIGIALSAAVVPAAAAPPRERKLGAAVAPIRLVPRGSGTIAVGGLHSFFGTVELASAGDGLVVSNRLPLERYVYGLNEVPPEWPAEALKAQAVAARTYALWTLSRPPAGDAAVYGFDICASTDCQVFSGADVALTKDGERWVGAVDATRGEAVLYEGRPILARYHSTSGGQTLDNPQAFPGEPSYPYLRSVPSTTEGGSPLYRWRTSFRLAQLEAIVRRVGWWTGGPLVSVRSVASRSGLHYPDVVFQGNKGRVVHTAEELRDVVRDLAPAMYPGSYPSAAATASGRLPETFPSNRITVSTRGKTVEVVGRGWGHGVGMSQWGAHGLAAQGASYADILGHYYKATSVGPNEDTGAIEVGVSWGLPTVSASGSFDIVDGRGRTLVRGALGTWNFTHAGAGAVAIDPPPGFGLPLRVGIVRAPKRVKVGEPTYLTIALSRPARVRATTSQSPTRYRDPGSKVKNAGRQRLVWLAPLEPGRYRVSIRATAGATRARSDPVNITVLEPRAAEGPGEGPGPLPRDADRGAGWLVVSLVGSALIALGGSALLIKRLSGSKAG